MHPEDEPDALIAAQTPDQPGAYSGPYGAGAVWAVLGGDRRAARQRRARRRRSGPARTCSSSTPHHVEGVLDLRVGDGVTCYATCFTPGLALPAA